MADILLVEDDDIVLRMLERYIGSLGHRVIAVGNPVDAQRIIEDKTREKIDWLFTDFGLKHTKNGADLAIAAKNNGIERIIIHTTEPEAAKKALVGETGVQVIDKIYENFRVTLEALLS